MIARTFALLAILVSVLTAGAAASAQEALRGFSATR